MSKVDRARDKRSLSGGRNYSAVGRFGARLVLLGAFLPALVVSAPSMADDGPASNVVEALQRRLDSGAVKLAYADDGKSYVPELLKAFRIPSDSQLLVFSASSLQYDRIHPDTPRAIYYQDDAALGTVQNGRAIELIVSDKNSGVAFYTLDVNKADKPRFERQTSVCMACHGYTSRWAPGLMVGNLDTGPNGQVLNSDPTRLFRLTDDRSPYDQRYGGWYITGSTGAMKHRGNVVINPDDPMTLPAGGQNILSLADRINLQRYLSPGSDIVSMLTFEHQSGVSNLIARINAQHAGLSNDRLPPERRATQGEVDASIEELARYLTFADQAPLPSPVEGSSSFTQTFPGQGPRDGQGRSLRDFDLRTRVFRYPLSYMVYSQAFDNLNPAAKERVWRRLYDLLSGKDRSPDAPHIDPTGGAAAIAILAATRQGLPDYWKPIQVAAK